MLRVRKKIGVETKKYILTMIALEFYGYHFLLSSVYTSLVYVACRFSINIIEDSRATKLRFVQHATGLPETGRIVQQV